MTLTTQTQADWVLGWHDAVDALAAGATADYYRSLDAPQGAYEHGYDAAIFTAFGG